MKKLDFTRKFLTVKGITGKVSDICGNVNQVGYILPGHGLKGKHHFISSDDDLAEMYIAFKGKLDILLWC